MKKIHIYFCIRAIGDCDYGVCGDCNAVGVIHTSPKSGGKKVTLFGSDCDVGVIAGVGAIHTGPKSGGEISHFLAVTVIVV